MNLDKLRTRRMLRRWAGTVPLVLATMVHASFPPEPTLRAEYEQRAQDLGAKFSILYTDGGAFIGFGMIRMMHGGTPFIGVTIASNSNTAFKVRQGALNSGWNGTSAARIVVTVNSGVYQGDNSLGVSFYDKAGGDAAWPTGTTITLINNGYIIGQGGAGGPGGNSGNGGNGSSGGHAINFSGTIGLTIDNTNGYILGGGGGGGGGASYSSGLAKADGGGGGGGGGYQWGTGGAAGPIGSPGNGADGSTDKLHGGTGGGGGFDSFYLVNGGGGGNGGDVANDGNPGGNTATNSGGSGGSHGSAVQMNGAGTPTWLGGNNGTQVQGGVFG